MAPSSTIHYQIELKVAFFLIFFFIYLPSKPAGLASPVSATEAINEERDKLVGSKPPDCANKCLSCKPCMATLVTQPSQWKRFRASQIEEGDGGYYLVSWKCKCGNKLFHP